MTTAKTVKAASLKGKIDFAIITIRDDEFQAVLKRFQPEFHAQGRRRYSISRVVTLEGDEYVVAAVRCAEQGTGESQNVTNDLIQDLNPQWIVVTGIAGGVPDEDYTLGDVVAATRLQDFSLEAVNDGRNSEYGVAGGPMHREIQNLLAHLPAMEAQLAGWNQEESIGVPRPGVSHKAENFYGATEWQEKARRSLKVNFGTAKAQMFRLPKVVTASFASSDKLVKDTGTMREWQKTARQVRAVEMELAGVYRAARQRNREYPVLAIRGISDIVGFKRDPKWIRYACETAAAFTAAIIKARPIHPKGPKAKPYSAASRATTQEESKMALSVSFQPTIKAEASVETEYLYSNLLIVKPFPEILFTGRSLCSDAKDVYYTLKSLGEYPGNEWIEKDGTLYSFHDLRESPWNKVCDAGTVSDEKTTHWSNSKDLVELRYFVELLNQCLREKGNRMLLNYSDHLEYYYFTATGNLTARKLSYPSIHKNTSREIFGGYPKNSDGEYDYYRHSAFKGQFVRYEGKWFLEITPTYHFTSDGHVFHRRHEQLRRGIKKFEKHAAVRGQVIMWAAYLQGACHNKKIEYPFLNFGPLEAFEVDFGINDQEWLKKDEIEEEEAD